MELLILFIILLSIISMWVLSIVWLFRWNKFWHFFIFNGLLLLTYLICYENFDMSFIVPKHPYGINTILLEIGTLTFHVLVVFIFSIFRRNQLRKLN